MKKNILLKTAAVIFAAGCIACFTGCGKKSQSVTGKAECQEKLAGKWVFMIRSENDICSNPGTPDELLQGDVSVLVKTTLEFDKDLSCTMTLENNVEKIRLNKDSVFTEEDVRSQLERFIRTYGKFAADENRLQIENSQVMDAAGNLYDIDEYRQADPSIDRSLVVGWEVQDDVLFIKDLSDGGVATYHRTK